MKKNHNKAEEMKNLRTTCEELLEKYKDSKDPYMLAALKGAKEFCEKTLKELEC